MHFSKLKFLSSARIHPRRPAARMNAVADDKPSTNFTNEKFDLMPTIAEQTQSCEHFSISPKLVRGSFPYYYLIPSLLLPLGVSAALTEPKNLTDFANNFNMILNGGAGWIGITQLLIGFCFFGIIIGILKYSGAGGNEEKLGEGKQLIMYGIIGLFIAFTFWGLAKLLAKTYLGV